MKNLILTLVSSLALLTSCSQREEGEAVIRLGAPSTVFDINAVLTITDTLWLNENGHYLKKISKIETFGQRHFLLDKSNYSVYAVDENDLCLRQIGVRGHGRGEYTDIQDFTVRPDNGHIVLLSRDSKIHEFTADGEFIQSKTIGKSLFWSIIATDWGYICATNHRTYTSGNEAYLLYCFDKEFNLLSRHIPVLPYQVSAPTFMAELFKRVGSEVLYLDPFGLAIYSISGPENLTQKYALQLDNFMPQECLTNGMTFMEKQLDYNWIMEWWAVDSQLIFSYIYDKEYRVAQFSALDQTTTCYQYDFEQYYWGVMEPIFGTPTKGVLLSSCSLANSTDVTYGIVRWREKGVEK